MSETELYQPIKSFLEAQGFTVKAEIRSCDVVAVREEEAPVIVELKTALNLQLFYQAVDRLGITDQVYVAVPRPKRGVPAEAVKLCRRIGIGLLVVSGSGSVDVLTDPVPYAPRQNARRRHGLLSEFRKRLGDLNTGGSRGKALMTAYRQDALRCAIHLAQAGASRVKDIRQTTRVERSASILRGNVYGWFQRETRGVYALTDAGVAALEASQSVILQLFPTGLSPVDCNTPPDEEPTPG
jgi:hypothetical protein